MNPKVIWRIWCEPKPGNPLEPTWTGPRFQSKADAQKHNEKHGGSEGICWKFIVGKFPQRREQ